MSIMNFELCFPPGSVRMSLVFSRQKREGGSLSIVNAFQILLADRKRHRLEAGARRRIVTQALRD
jgi:hypothetical protein